MFAQAAKRSLFPYRFVLNACIALVLITTATFAQTDNARIVGTVRDQNGAIVAGATVIVKNERTNEERTTTTADDGQYSVTALKAANYTIHINAASFAQMQRTSVELNVGQQLTLDFTVSPTGIGESVNVVGSTETTLQSDSASLSANVNPREVGGLPLNGRQLSQLYLQAPGALNSGSGTFGDIRFNGRAVEQNIVRYDGVEGTAIIDASPGNLNGEVPSPFRLQSSLENVQEFRVESSNYTAEFGTGTGGQINVVTKSGGNQFHGSLFEFFRNDKLDAANFFDNIAGQKAPLRLNQFGGSMGGPIIKDKLFFFTSVEAYRLRAGINSTEAVPGAQSRICAVVSCVESNGQASRTLQLLPAFRAPGAVIVSTGTGSNLFDVAQLQANTAVNETAYALRLDYKLNQSNSLYFRFFRDNGTNDQPEGVSGRRVVITANPQNGVAGIQTILSPRLLNEFKFGYNGVFTRINGQAPIINGIDISKLAINISGNTASFALPGQGTSAGTANPGGLVRANSATNGRGQPYTVYSLSFIDNLNYTVGNHNMKFGGEIRPNRIYTDRLGGTTYVFNNLPSFLTNSPASIQFLGDVSEPSAFNNGFTGNRLAKSEYYIAYAQDEWKIRSNLTLNYGLRYEYYTPLREANNNDVIFDTINGVLKSPDTPFFIADKKAFGPRVALTYAPNFGKFFGNGRTVLRGGFGIYYGPGQVEDQIQPIESDRISSTISSGSLLAFDPNQAAFISAVRANFISNPTNRTYQPRAYAPEYKVPEKIYQYTFSIQQELPYKLVGTAAYVGSQGRNLFLRGLSNTLRPGVATILDAGANTVLPTNAGVVNRTNAAGQTIAVTNIRQFDLLNQTVGGTFTSILRPFAEIDTKTSGGTDSYNALQLALARRLSNGLTLNSQYTFSKSFGNTSGSNEARTAAQPANGNNLYADDANNYEADRGFNSFDVRHTFNLSAIYDLPVGNGKRFDMGRVGNAIFNNFEIGGIVNARSGLPVDITVVRPDTVAQCVSGPCTIFVPDTANPGKFISTTVPVGFTTALPSVSSSLPLPTGFRAVTNAPGGGASRQTRRPDIVAGVSPYLNNDRNFLNPAAFAIPQAGTFGSLPRNALKGPNFKQFDVILNKRVRFNERMNVELRAEIYNIFNQTNFANPASTLNSALPAFTATDATATNGLAARSFVLGSGLQPGQAFTQSTAGSTFGLLRQTIERTVGLGTNRQIQFAMRFNF